MKTTEAIEILERRADYLAKIIAEKAELNMHRERAELGALRLAVRELEVRRQINIEQASRETA